MMSFFQYEFDPNVKFDMYTPMHLLMLGITVVLFVLFFVFKKRIAQSPHEQRIRQIIGVAMCIQLVTLIIIDGTGGYVYLPFHLCSMSYILTIILLFTDNKNVFWYLFFTGIIGGIVTFAIPELDHAGWNRFRFYEFIVAHTMIIIVPIYYLTERKYKITLRHTILGILITNIIGFSMIPINILLDWTGIVEDANYMFVMNAPEDVRSVFGESPWHLLSFELVLVVTFFALYGVAQWYQSKQKAA